MTKLSWRRISILGVVLMAASAVTAAIIPSVNSDAPVRANGTLIDSSLPAGGDLTCVPSANAGACTYTADSGTTTGDNGTADHVTANNTTL